MTISGNVTIGELLSVAAQELKQVPIDTPRLDAEMLLSHVLNCARIDLVLNRNYILTSIELEKFSVCLKRRIKHEPIAYIVGGKEFMSLFFHVKEGILIPRPETELIVEKVIDLYKKEKSVSILDLCTGSGAIAVSLAYYLKQAHVTAIDKFDVCVSAAKQNAFYHHVPDRVLVVQGDVLQNLQIDGSFDCIVSNPPYVTREALLSLPQSVKDYEPEYALNGGDDGLLFYRAITEYAVKLLKVGGRLVFEIGYDQGTALQDMLHSTNAFTAITVTKDYAGLDRMVTAIREDVI